MDIKTCIFRLLEDYNTISFAGIDKNSGKTTVLNKTIEAFWGKEIFGLTSIGIDGEEVDQITSTPKPRIYVPRGTIFATTRNLVKSCDVTKEILEITDINTPIGEVIIIKAHSDGFIEIAGPSTAMQTKKVIEIMKYYGATKFFIDGALSRKSHAIPILSDCVVISAGASISPEPQMVAEIVKDLLKKLTIKKFNNQKIINQISELDENIKIVLFNLDAEEKFRIKSDNQKQLIEAAKFVSNDMCCIYIKGAFLDSIFDLMIKNINKNEIDFSKLTFIVEDGTKIFLKPQSIELMDKLRINLTALNTITVPFVSANPIAPQGYCYKKDEFVKLLGEVTKSIVIDVVGGDVFEAYEK